MTTTAALQITLDNALVPLEKRVETGKCNMRIDPAKTQKEPTYQVVLDDLALTTCYLAFLITADVLEIYMQQFWFTINKKDSTTYKFKTDNKSYRIDMEVFREIFQICPRLPNKDFDELPSDDEIMYQPWRNFASIINKCLSRKITGLDKLRLSRAQILWEMFYKKKLDFVELLWEDFTFQIENRDHKKKEKMYYPRFTKAIIHHFISKDKSISMRNRMFMHTTRDDSILGPMRFVSKSDDFQVYGALLPKRMTNQQIRDSDAYKTYLAYATGAASPKMKRKLKKPTSPSKQTTLITEEEEELEPAKRFVSSKKPATKRQSGRVQIRDTPGVSVSNKKAPAKVEKSKGIELLSDAALLQEAQLKKALRRSKRDTTIHQAGGSSEGADFESNVPDEPKGKSIDISEGTSLKPGVLDVSTTDSSESENESWGDSGDEANEQSNDEDEQNDNDHEQANDERTKYDDEEEETQDDEYVHTPDDYVPKGSLCLMDLNL
ncbi:hypothetical protein Tco_0098784 [Tanacetum coccineum]